MVATETDALRAFYERRHPRYMELITHWLFLAATYNGGREWFWHHIHKYHKEGNEEFRARLQRAYRFNHTREVVDLVQKYLFKAAVQRNENPPEAVKAFWDCATLSCLTIDQLMRNASTDSSIGGRIAISIDNNLQPLMNDDGTPVPISIQQLKDQNARLYATIYRAEDILDYAWDTDGDGGLLWVKLRETHRDDIDPLNSTGLESYRVRLWTREGWSLYEDIELPMNAVNGWSMAGGRRVPKRKIQIIDSGIHNLGRVPVVFVDHTTSADPYRVAALIDDIAYLDRATANYLSNLDAIIQDQTFSQLAIPAQALMPGDDAYEKILELGTKRIFVYDGGAGSTSKPEFISPDAKQAELILAVIAKIVDEIYHTIGLAGERTKQDNSQGIDNSSGVAKAYDFERVNALLVAKASYLEKAENEIVDIVLAWVGQDDINGEEEKLVSYPTTFDVMRLADELATAQALALINAPLLVRRQQMLDVVNKLFPQLAADLKAKLTTDVNTWLEGFDPVQAAPITFGKDQPAPGAPSRQGQVTKDTPTATD